MRVGIFGGTFDPVHLGHLMVAEQCREQGRLDQVWFVPAPRPPHKLDRAVSPFGQRVEMLALAIAGNPAFRIDEIEKERTGPSYTADTLQLFHQRQPELDLSLLIGSDCLPDLPRWHQPEQIVERAALLVVARPGWPILSVEELRDSLNLGGEVPLRMQVVPVPLIDLSSTDLRRRAGAGHSLRYLVPRAVECYVQEKRLYANEPRPSGSVEVNAP
jgi:nicotinate-nucleotide adenylyltransferase